MSVQNPYESPERLPALPPVTSGSAGSPRIRLGVLGFHCLLLAIFPPTHCPCGMGPIGYIVLPYMLLLGAPSIALPLAFPYLRSTGQTVFLVLYVFNYVLLSYAVGHFIDRIRTRRKLYRQLASADGQ